MIFTTDVEEKLKEICEEIALRFEIESHEIETVDEHGHFLVQSVPTYSRTKTVHTIKSINGKEIFRQMPKVKEKLWG